MELFKLFGTIAINNADANSSIDETTDRASGASSSMTGAFKKIGAAVGTYLAVDKIISFGQSCVQAAATVKAQTAQFEAAFGDLQGKASTMFQKIGEDTGVLATRLQVVGTGAFSQFKGAGLDAAEALEKTGEYTNLAADAAAYYDMSLEEADSLMRSFIRGNTEAGDRIGLFTSETQRNEAALAKLGKKYIDCTEAEKQMIMLDIASSIYESSGAMGQASREADGYENVMGNLKESWRQFMAVLGTPLLEKVVPIIQRITSGIGGLVEKFKTGTNPMQVFVDKISALYGWFKDIASYAAGVFKPVLDDIKTVFTAIKDAVQPLIDRFKEYVSSGEAANDITSRIKNTIDTLKSAYDAVKEVILTVVQGFKDAAQWGKEHETAVTTLAIAFGTLTAAIVAYNVAQAIKNAGGIVEIAQLAATAIGVGALTVAETAHTVATTIATAATTAFGAAVAFLTSPITLVIVAIGLLVAAGVALYKNWDVVSEKCSELWGKVKEAFSKMKESVLKTWDNIKTATSKTWNSIKSTLSNLWNSLKTAVSNTWNGFKTAISNAWNAIKTTTSNVWNSIKTFLLNLWNSIKATISNVWNGIKSTITNILNGIKSTMSNIWNGIKTTVSNAINGVKSTISSGLNSAKSTVSNVLNGIKDKFSSIWESAKNIVSSAIDKIKSFMNFSWSLPHIKLPHFKISGKFSLNPPSVPSFGVDWYKKAMDTPYIMNSPTIFGYNAKTGQYMGGGEAGSEVVSGTNTLMTMIQGAVATQNGELVIVLYKILEAILTLDENMGGHLREALAGTSFEINKREFARLVKAVT